MTVALSKTRGVRWTRSTVTTSNRVEEVRIRSRSTAPAIRSRRGAGSSSEPAAIERHERQPAGQQSGEEHAGAERVDLVPRDGPPQRRQPIEATVGQHRRGQRAGGGARDEPHRRPALHERRGSPRLPGALGATAGQHERQGRVERRPGRLAGSRARGQRQAQSQREQRRQCGSVATTTAPSTIRNATASFQRGDSPRYSHAKPRTPQWDAPEVAARR